MSTTILKHSFKELDFAENFSYNKEGRGDVMSGLEIVEDFKTRFNKALDLRNQKPIDVVNATGISESAISQYRSGLTKPKRERLTLIANHLKVNPTWLLGLDVPMEVTKQDDSTITADEYEIIQKYRALDHKGQQIVVSILNREIEHKAMKESINNRFNEYLERTKKFDKKE